MPRLILLAAILSWMIASQAAAREWISRDGKFSIEAELIDFDKGDVLLKRADGKVAKVPLSKLSLADSKYVQEALAALGRNLVDELPGAKKPRPATTDPGDDEPAEEAEAEPVVAAAAGEPPLARTSSSYSNKWQVRPDSQADPYGIPPSKQVSIKIAGSYGNSSVLYPSVASPFVGAKIGTQPGREGPLNIFDLRTGRAIGKVDAEGYSSKRALSPDGQHYAEASSRGLVNLWSVDKGKIIHSIDPGGRVSSIRDFDFAGPNRLLILSGLSDFVGIWDVKTGKKLAEIKFSDRERADSLTVTPGGCYVAIPMNGVVKIYDTRNGALAGTLKANNSSDYDQAKGLVFSNDGTELAGFSGSGSSHFVCWSMAKGQVLSEFTFESPRGSSGGTVTWFADKSAWWVFGSSVLDRKTEKIIYTQPDDSGRRSGAIRRYIDADRMLMVQGKDSEQHVLTTVPIDKDLLVSGAKIVGGGGTTDDVGLPPITNAEMPTEIGTLLPANDWEYKPVAAPLSGNVDLSRPMVLSYSAHRYRDVYFSKPTPARAVIAVSPESGIHTDTYLTYDLTTRRQVAQFKVPFKTECIAVGPEGKLGLFRIPQKEDRLDVFDLIENKHVVGFRPYSALKDYHNQVKWAVMPSADMVLTVNVDAKLVAWSLPSCKPKWAMEIGKNSYPALDAARKNLAVSTLDGFHLVDVETGKVIASLERPSERPDAYVRQVEFRSDGKALAAMYDENDRTVLCTWNLEDGSVQREMRLACPCFTFGWVGPNQILLRSTSPRVRGTEIRVSDLAKLDQCSLVDLERGFLTWTYQHPNGRPVKQQFADRHWAIVSSGTGQAGHLVNASLPDPEASKLLKTAQPPAPLLEANGKIKLTVEVEGDFPVSSADQQNRAVLLKEGIEQRFVNLLTAQKITREDFATVELKVILRERQLNTAVEISPRLRPYESKVVLLTTTVIEVSLSALANGGLVWQESHNVTANDVDFSGASSRIPSTIEPKQYYRMKLWEIAVKKASDTKLPIPLYSSEQAEGLGESEIIPSGSRILRKPIVAQDKQT